MLWNVRFGQIFRSRLDALEQAQPNQFRTRLQDCLYFHSHEAEVLASRSQPTSEALKALDLNLHLDAYRRHFTAAKVSNLAALDGPLAEAFKTTLILVPHQGHETLSSRPMDVDCQSLRAAGFDVRYADYQPSLGEPATAAKELFEWLRGQENLQQQVLFIAYDTGIRVLVEMMASRKFRDVPFNTRGIVSLAGALQTSVDETPRFIGAQEFLALVERFRLRQEKPLEARVIKIIKEILGAEKQWSKVVMEIMHQLEACASHFVELKPEFLETRQVTLWKWPEEFVAECDLFSITPLQPRELLVGSGVYPQNNLDDLFLYLTSAGFAAEHAPFNDTHLTYAEMQFPTGVAPRIVPLATLRTDHWGLVLPWVISSRDEDLFPRRAMMEALVLTLCEYFG